MTKLRPYKMSIAIGLSISISFLLLGSTWSVSAQEQTQPLLRQISDVNITLPKNDNRLTVTPSSLNHLFKQVENSVVQITSQISQGVPNAFSPQTPNATALGSGFIYDKVGHTVTNAHVVEDANIVDVTFPNGDRYTAKVVGMDPYGRSRFTNLRK
jgi:S1-C subfamily serine protease